ncbi:MAG: hypothetical protein M1281_18330 [Chloroflexi bacterium]|nr:hypothetical protein [Chloroflexota bacterium]
MKTSRQVRSCVTALSIVLCLFTLASCSEISPIVFLPTLTMPAPLTPAPTQPPTATPNPADFLYFDNFQDPASGWWVEENEDASFAYDDGYYTIRSKKKEIMQWSIPGQQFADASIQVETIQVEGPSNDNTSFGILCRAQSNGDGYALRVSADGYYSIFLVKGDDFTPLIAWTESSYVRQGNQINQLKAICSGSDLSLYANGELLGTVRDETFPTGDVGLAATTYEDSPVEVRYDNFRVDLP